MRAADTTKNQVLNSLPTAVRRAVLEAGTRVDLEAGTVLTRAGEPLAAVHFPETAVISTLATYRDGTSIEMANIGREACTGVGLALGRTRQLSTNEVQIGGVALELSARSFTHFKASIPEFEDRVFAMVQAIFYQVMVSGACHGAHGAKQRLARWLLTMRDRNDDEIIPLTQDFLAEMLGLRRATVTNCASQLQDEGLVAYTRGRIMITDAAGLERASCECYRLVREAYDTLLPAGDANG
jgi:CRP-like cAMP-binding protein